MGILGNGNSLIENLVPSGLANVATRLVEAVAINSISEKARRGRTLVVKRRNIHSEQLADLTNLYFRMADIPIRFWSKVEDWQAVGSWMLRDAQWRSFSRLWLRSEVRCC